jgi:isoleucyl-tRNA synthetase
MLSRLQTVIATCREAYAAYDFRRVFQTLNQFVTVDVSSLYVDITKDRLYCDAADSPRRLATESVMQTVVDALCRLLAPILAFTADEAWEYSGAASSVHMEVFPAVDESLRNPEAEATVEEWLKVRAVVSQAAEQARQLKIIGKALEAKVTVESPAPGNANLPIGELEEFLILSELQVVSGTELKATLVRNENKACARCWRARASVGFMPDPELCDRCADVVARQKAAAV